MCGDATSLCPLCAAHADIRREASRVAGGLRGRSVACHPGSLRVASLLLGQSPSWACARAGLRAGKRPCRPVFWLVPVAGTPAATELRAQDRERVGPGRGPKGLACTWSEGHRVEGRAAPRDAAGAGRGHVAVRAEGGHQGWPHGRCSRRLLPGSTQSTVTFEKATVCPPVPEGCHHTQARPLGPGSSPGQTCHRAAGTRVSAVRLVPPPPAPARRRWDARRSQPPCSPGSVGKSPLDGPTLGCPGELNVQKNVPAILPLT